MNQLNIRVVCRNNRPELFLTVRLGNQETKFEAVGIPAAHAVQVLFRQTSIYERIEDVVAQAIKFRSSIEETLPISTTELAAVRRIIAEVRKSRAQWATAPPPPRGLHLLGRDDGT